VFVQVQKTREATKVMRRWYYIAIATRSAEFKPDRCNGVTSDGLLPSEADTLGRLGG